MDRQSTDCEVNLRNRLPVRPRSLGIIVAAFFTVSIAYSVRYGYGMLLPGMLETMQISKVQAGMISASYFAAYTLFSPVVGGLSDRSNPRILLTLFTALLAVGTLLMALVSTVFEASLAFGLVGMGHAACWAPVVSQVQHWVSDRYRGTALSVATMGSGIGIAVWSLWLPMVIARSSYRQGWLQMGIFALFVVLLNYLLVRQHPDSISRVEKVRASGKSGEPWYSSYATLLTSRILWVVGCAYACIGFTVLVPFTFLSVYVTESLQLSYALATSFFTVMAVAGLIGKVILGVLSDRLGRVPVMMICGLFLGCGCLGVVLSVGIAAKYFWVALAGMGFGAVWPVYAAAAIDFFPRSQSGSVIGLWTVYLGVGSILSPVLCGWSIDVSGSYNWAFFLGFGGGLLSVLLLLPLVYPFRPASARGNALP